MTLSAHQPATQMDLACCAVTTTMQVWAMAKVQLKLGPSWAVRLADGAGSGPPAPTCQWRDQAVTRK